MESNSAPEESQAPIKEAAGTIKQAVGWATGDRRVEAEGEVDQEEAAVQEGEISSEAVEDVEEAEPRVRQEHGDLGHQG